MSEKEKLSSYGEWTEIIRPKSSLMYLGIRDLWMYRDLIVLFVKRDFVSVYKQTILGPLWHILQPMLTTLIFMYIFGHIAGLSTDGAPSLLFYMAGVTLWSYFSQTLAATSSTFVNNANLFGKVYFPRLTVPVANTISSFISFAIQVGLFIGFYIWFKMHGADIKITSWIFAMPLFLFIMALWSLGLGIIVSSLTTKYRDLRQVINFGIQLYMYLSPVILPVSSLNKDLQFWAMLNPVAPVLEGFRYALLGTGYCSFTYLVIAILISSLVFIGGLMMFNKVEKTFMDTV